MSRHVCGLAGLMSCDASRRCPCDPTYPNCKTMSRDSWRWIVKLYCAVYCVRIFGWKSPYSSIGRKLAQSVWVLGLGLRIPVNGLGLMKPACDTNGVLRNVEGRNVLPPNGGSAPNCSSTNCSIGL